MDEEKAVISINCNVDITLRHADGTEEREEVHNLVCTAGMAKLLLSTAGAKYLKDYCYICIGTGTNAAAAGDTSLQTEVTRHIATVSNPTTASLRFEYTFAAGDGTGAITEGALDYAGTATGAILSRTVFDVKNKDAGSTLTYGWTITLA